MLCVHFGDDTNVTRFQIEVSAPTAVSISMFQVDRDSKDILAVTSTSSTQRALGASAADSYLGGPVTSGIVYIGKTVTTGEPEMSALCQSLCEEAQWFVTGEGETAANQYGNILKPRAPVTIKGIGETYSGVYYVTHVDHVFTADGYIQRFGVKRNALKLAGDEDFSGSDVGLLGNLF